MRVGIRSDNKWLLTRLEVGRELRGQGFASMLLDHVLENADKKGATIVLSIEPDGTGMSEELLRLFYKSRGFQPITGFHPITEFSETAMIRFPKLACVRK